MSTTPALSVPCVLLTGFDAFGGASVNPSWLGVQALQQTAGTFVCNHVFYGLMHALATDPSLQHARGGFVHVPELSVLPLPALVGGLQVLVEAALTARSGDLRLAAGAIA